jgi:hypothetical protein
MGGWQRPQSQTPVLYLNYGGLDLALTDEKCQFHFRSRRGYAIMSALMTSWRNGWIKRVYVINQDYVWATA